MDHQQLLLPLRDAGSDTAVSQPVVPAKLRRVRTGKACRRCANIKCKCIRTVEGQPCERCRRLKATCEPAPAMSTQRTPATTASRAHAVPRSRTARLEARLDDLVNLLQTSRTPLQEQTQPQTQMQSGPLASPRSPASPASSGLSKDVIAGSGPYSCLQDCATNNSPADLATPSGHSEMATGMSTAATTPDESGPYQYSLTLDEAESRLRRFREDMLPLCPFHYIPPTTTAAEISQKSPFLWLCIRVVTDPSPLERTRLALVCRRVIIHRIVEEEERSLEILLSLLTFLSWNNLPFPKAGKSSRVSMSLLSQVAVAVAWDLGLTTPPLLVETGSELAPGRYIGPPPNNTRRSEHMDERRAVLGVYLVTLNVSQKYRTADGLRWSPYLDSCLAYLDKHSTVPQDKALVQIVKMQLLVNQVNQVPITAPMTLHCTGNKPGSSVLDGLRSIPVPFIESLRAELGAIVQIGPDGMSPFFDNFTVHILYHFAMLSLHETVMFPPPPSQTTTQLPSLWAISDLQRFEMYQRCLQSVKAVIDRILSWPLETFFTLPPSSFLLLCPMFRWLYRLTTLRDSVWDPNAARSVIDPVATLDRFIDRSKRFGAIHAKDNPAGYDECHGKGNLVDMMSTFVARITAFKRAWQSDLAAHAQGPDARNRTGTTVTSTGYETDAIPPSSSNIDSSSGTMPTPPGLGASAAPAEIPLLGDDLSYLFADGLQNYQFDFGDLFQAGPGFIGG